MPPFSFPCSGPVLICGSADSLYDDIDNCHRPGAALIGVNGAPVRAMHRFSCHTKNLKAKGWVQPGELCHSIEAAPWVDYVWPTVNDVSGTSGWAAAKMALLMGYEEVILCGIPIDASPYTTGRPAKSFEHEDILEAYRVAIFNDIEYHGRVHSMSGWTRELLGPPK